MEFILSVLVVFGISYIICKSYIFEKFRGFFGLRSKFLDKFINCPLCVGFWLGIFISLTYTNLINCWFPLAVVFNASALTISSYFLHNILDFFEEKNEIFQVEDDKNNSK